MMCLHSEPTSSQSHSWHNNGIHWQGFWCAWVQIGRVLPPAIEMQYLALLHLQEKINTSIVPAIDQHPFCKMPLVKFSSLQLCCFEKKKDFWC